VKGLVKKELDDLELAPTALRLYRYSSVAEDPEAADGPVGYELTPLYSTLWKTAGGGPNETYGEAVDYGTRTIKVAAASDATSGVDQEVRLGLLGSALRGVAGARNKARPPWGWFDMGDRDRPLGEWFFDPAGTVARHLGPSARDWSAAYLHQPFVGVIRGRGLIHKTTPAPSSTRTSGP
jgi:hypothetical protein